MQHGARQRGGAGAGPVRPAGRWVFDSLPFNYTTYCRELREVRVSYVTAACARLRQFGARRNVHGFVTAPSHVPSSSFAGVPVLRPFAARVRHGGGTLT